MIGWTSRHFDLEEAAEGVYAAIAREEGGAMGNAGFVDLGDRIVVFDTFNSPQAARDLRAAAERMTGRTEFLVVNSHWHGDHVRGNQVFEEAPILSDPETRRLMEAEHPARIRRQQEMLPQLDRDIEELERQWETAVEAGGEEGLSARISFLKEMRLALPELRLTLPTETIAAERRIDGPARSVRLISCGAGHTASDLIAEVPEAGVLFAGDLVSVENHPMLEGGDPPGWVNTLTKLERAHYAKVIPGHGPVDGSGSITAMKAYLQDLLRLAGDPAAGDRVPDAYRAWKADFLYIPNLEYIRKNAFPQ
ncbi:MBL fold metallo-hydrolase [Gorillibacterium sp. sgz500922]|uniref:MBL fold metallo-hydrolase n=1 Tax=Gorillibacterium sp. sgz500922 TaxID=3446694 RepID=UPI003F671E39